VSAPAAPPTSTAPTAARAGAAPAAVPGPADDVDDAAHHDEIRTLRPGLGPRLTGPMLPPGQEAAARRAEAERGQGRRHPLRAGRATIGRARTNDIVLGDLLASREHAELFVGRSGIEIVDLGSANGTFVNGLRVERRLVTPGDVIAIGHHLFHVGQAELVEYLDAGDVSFEVDGLCVDVGETRLLHDVTFRLPGRSLLAVIGPSGAGKSTLLNALTGFRPADTGTVRYAGRDLYAEYDELRRRIGYVPQEDILHTTLTVRQALEYGAKLRFPTDTTAEERRARIDEVLVELGLTGGQGQDADGWPGPAAGGAPNGTGGPGGGQGQDLADRRVSKLSGGQRKRTSVALELLTQPTLLFLDEPTSGLDPGLDKEVMQSLRRLADGGRTVIVVTHSVAHLELCDYLLVLAKGGHVAYFGPPQHALSFFGAADWADAFQLLKSGDGAARLARRYRSSGFFIQGSAMVPVARPEPAPLPSIRQQSVFSQLLTLCRRYLRVIASDSNYLKLLIAYPFILGLVPRLVEAPFGLGEGAMGQPNREATLLLVILVLNACFLGTSNSVREIVKEREIYRRERAIGLSTTAYLGSKVIVLTVVTALQAAVLTAVGLAGRAPNDGVVSDYPLLELMAVVAAIAVTSAMMGLVISALVDNADKTMPLLVLAAMSQLAFTGALLKVIGRPVLEQISYLSPARWGYAAAASVSDLDDIQKIGDPRLNPGSVPDPLWAHTASAYLTDLAGIVAVGVLCVIATALLLRRLDPHTGRRRAQSRQAAPRTAAQPSAG
ncbi:MAG: ATP-binding cassette domain-containing protein, partial [Frankia sp.]|nr:ATP-binding cassette domain-containing protein [Frankia sp.]